MQSASSPPRDAPCPCGSGKRYRNCHGAAPSVGETRAVLSAAVAAQRQGRLEEAERLCNRVLAHDPSNFDALHMLGVTCFRRQQFARAHALIRSACAARPDSVEAARNLIVTEEALRRVDGLARYRNWIVTHERASIAAHASLREALARRTGAPRLSVVLPVYNAEARWLTACLDSVLRQDYPNWELCIADDASTDPVSREILADHAARDARIRIVWRTVNGHISAASNSALEVATGEYIALLDHDDALPAHALGEVALALLDRPSVEIVYSDEDKLDGQGKRFDPYFKPDWNPGLANSQNFVSHLGVYRTELVRSVGGFREGYEGAQDWDLILRCAERVPSAHIHHVPQVLYHWRAVEGSTARTVASKDYASAAQERVVRDHARRCGVDIAITRVVDGTWLQADPIVAAPPPISLVVLRPPSMPSSEAVDRWMPHAGAGAIEIIPIALESESSRALDDEPPSLGRSDAQAVNAAVAAAKGDLIVFVAANARPTDAAWLSRLAAHAIQPGIGCVGGVTFDSMRRTARGGYVLDAETIAATAFAREHRDFVGMMGRNQVVQNLSALGLSGLAVRRVTWEAVHGLDVSHLAARYHDVDLCLRIGERGLRHVWHPGIVFADERPLRERAASPSGTPMASGDADYMRARHLAMLTHDPAYNPHLSRSPRLFEIPDTR